MTKDKLLLTIAAVKKELEAIDIRIRPQTVICDGVPLIYSYPESYGLDCILKQELERRLETLKLLQELGLYEEEKPVDGNRFTIITSTSGEDLYQVQVGGEYIGAYRSYTEARKAGDEACNKQELAEKEDNKHREYIGTLDLTQGIIDEHSFNAFTAINKAYKEDRDKRIKAVVNELYELTKRVGKDCDSYAQEDFFAIRAELRRLKLLETDMD